jgi:hypothetical protein
LFFLRLSISEAQNYTHIFILQEVSDIFSNAGHNSWFFRGGVLWSRFANVHSFNTFLHAFACYLRFCACFQTR